MMRFLKRAVGALVLTVMLAILPLAVSAQDYAPPPAAALAPQQIDQLVAQIALYPDPLIAQILMAATYPLEVVEAYRWQQNPQNAQLQGNQLDAALQQQPWDPSVKSLVAFPQVLALMDNNLQWTEQLGNAFLAQQGDVMDSVQRLRQMAQTSGHLASTPQQTVSESGGAIVVEPANPQVVYVPYYNPTVVYGAWPYEDYPPYYYPYSGYYYGAAGLIGFGVGIAVVEGLWGWHHWDWRDHRIDVNNRRFAEINGGHGPRVSGEWAHDPAHRHGVPYTSPAARSQFQGAADQSRRNYRGFASAGAPRTEGGAMTRMSRPNVSAREPAIQQRAPAQQANIPQPRQERQAPQVSPPTEARATPRQEGRPVFQQMQRPTMNIQQPQQPRQAPVFESFSHGTDTRVQSQRGANSLSTVPAAAPAMRQAAPPARGNAPQGGGGHNGHNEDMRAR